LGWAGAGWHAIGAVGQVGKWVVGHVYFVMRLLVLFLARRMLPIK
jgi:hypothetical protein